MTNEQQDKVNELASEIAQSQTELFFSTGTVGEMQDKVYTEPDESGMTSYTEEAQERFDELYDIWCEKLGELCEQKIQIAYLSPDCDQPTNLPEDILTHPERRVYSLDNFVEAFNGEFISDLGYIALTEE